MTNNSKNNYISIAKAMGIVLMVIGHSGCPVTILKFIYLFHMPLFFVCSGYFFKDIIDKSTLITFYHKRIKGLYLPYIKWSLVFLLLHNTFSKLNIIGSACYQKEEYLRAVAKLIAMTDYELLIRPFWFIKELLLASLIVSTLSFILIRWHVKYCHEIIFIVFLFFSILSKFIPHIPIIGDCSVLCFSILYYITGIFFRKYNHLISISYISLLISYIIVLSGSFLFIGNIDMRYTTAYNIIPYYLLSVIGIIMVYIISKKLDKMQYTSILYYIGNHTMSILALHLLALKFGNFLKTIIYGMPIEKVSDHPVISEGNTWFWILYTIIGIILPLLIGHLYLRLKQKIFFCQ